MGQHVNTFNKGMTKDYDVLLQPDGTYRHMVNCDLISQDGKNFVVKDCLGNVLTFTINTRYGHFTDTFDLPPMPIAFISFPDELIVFFTNNETEGGGYGEIGKLVYQPYGEGINSVGVTGNQNAGYVPLYHHPDLNFTKLRRIEGFSFEEGASIKRIYWTDNLNEPRVIDIGNPIYTTYIDVSNIVPGETYMVIEGVIKDMSLGGEWYGPTIGTNSGFQTNIFTATAGPYTDTNAPTPTAKIIKYYPLELLSWTPSRLLGNIKFKEYGGGNVVCGSKIYFYRLTDPSSGVQTSWSYGSAPIHVGTENSISASPSNTYFDFVGAGNETALVTSQKSVVITIENIDENFTNIEVAVAEFDNMVDVPRVINIVTNELITGSAMDIIHDGNSNLGELAASEITLFPASILKCKTITTNKNYNLIGNITERAEFANFDKTSVVISEKLHKMPVHEAENSSPGATQFCANILSYTDVSPDATVNPPTTDGIWPYTQWVVVSGVATYNSIAYSAGQVFEGVLGVYDWVNTSGTAQVRPCVNRNRYTTSGGNRIPDYIQFNDNDSDFWSYKNPAVASHVKGLWPLERYRYGILFYDLKGNPFFVRHLADHTASGIDANIPLMEKIVVNSDLEEVWYLNQRGITIDGIEIPESIIDKISGFSIVRAERDATQHAMGMLMQVGDATNSFRPLPSTRVNSTDAQWITSRNRLFTFICPDKMVDFPVSNYEVGSFLRTTHFNSPNLSGGNSMVSSSDAVYAMESKYFDTVGPETATPPTREHKIQYLRNVDAEEPVTNFGINNSTYYPYPRFGLVLIGPTTNDACAPSSPSDQMVLSEAVAGKRTLIEVAEDDVFAYDGYPSVTYGLIGGGSHVESDYKMFASVYTPKGSVYGGSTEAALANTYYISTGHYQPITSAVKADTYNGVDAYVFNNVEVWGGDAYNCLIDYGHSLYDILRLNVPPAPNYPSHSWGIKFPCICNSNYDLRRGRSVANNRMYPSATGVSYNPIRLEGFSYNSGYSSEGLAFLYPALPENFISQGRFKYRIRFAGQKIPGEIIDSFRQFLVNDYKDTDGQGGEINNLKTKDGRTFVWQNRIISTVPILEREVIAGSSGVPTSLGTGGVVDRFDPINSYFGNQHQWSLVETEYGFAWFDMRRKAMVVLSVGEGISEVSFVEGLKGFFDELFLEITDAYPVTSPLLNSPNFDEDSDRPLVGTGITGVYDPKFKKTYLTFKFLQRSSWVFEADVFHSFVSKDITVIYYHPTKMFIGFYDKWLPAIAHNHNQFVVAANNPKNRDKYYGPSMQSTTFTIGDIVSYNNSEYVCVAPVTIASYPGTSLQLPDRVGSLYWELVNSTNQVWVNNQPHTLGLTVAPDYLYNKHFGLVVSNELEFVVNPKTQNPFNVLNMEQSANGINVTDVYSFGDNNQSASDVGIKSYSKFYKIIYDKIVSSLPLRSNGSRITGQYLLVRLVKKNWTVSPTILTGSVRVLQYIKSFFQEKR